MEVVGALRDFPFLCFLGFFLLFELPSPRLLAFFLRPLSCRLRLPLLGAVARVSLEPLLPPDKGGSSCGSSREIFVPGAFADSGFSPLLSRDCFGEDLFFFLALPPC